MSESDSITDVVEICAILQCLGFTVKSLDTNDVNISQDGGSRTVVVNCQSSGFRAVLESGCLSCSCPTTNQENSGFWQMSGIAKGIQLEKETGSILLGSLPKVHRERITKELRELVRCIRESNVNESYTETSKEVNRSASAAELITPEKRTSLLNIKVDTPTRYRSLDTLTSARDEPDPPLPDPRPLQKLDSDADKKETFARQRQSTFSVNTTSGSVTRRNKTSSPIRAPLPNVLESLRAAERIAEELKNELTYVIGEFMEETKNNSSMSSLALDVSKISVMKGEASKAQFASSPNLSNLSKVHEDLTKSGLKRMDRASTSQLNKPTPDKEGRISKLRRISPNIFGRKKDSPSVKVDKGDGKNKLQNLFKPKVVMPVHVPKSTPEPSPNLSARKKFSHIKSTIPRPTFATKKE